MGWGCTYELYASSGRSSNVGMDGKKSSMLACYRLERTFGGATPYEYLRNLNGSGRGTTSGSRGS